MKKPVLIVIIAVAVVAIVAVVLFLFVLPGMNAEPEPVSSVYTPGDYFITNIKDSNMLVKAVVVLEVDKALDDEEFQTFLKENNHIIRHTINLVMRDRTYEEYSSEHAIQDLAQELTDRINEALGIDNVKSIYFNDYVVQ